MHRASAMSRFGLPCVIVLALSFAASAQPRGAGGAIVAVDEAIGGGPAPTRKASASRAKTSTTRTKTTTPKATPVRSFTGPTIGDKYSFLNFEVVDPVKPVHTNAAKIAGAKGLVQVEILVEYDGRVIAAKARTGNKLLWPEAERAALSTILNRPNLDGRPARALGFLVYRFGPAEE